MTYIQKNSPLKELDDNAQKRAMKREARAAMKKQGASMNKEDRAAREQMKQGEKAADPKTQKKKAIQDIRTNHKIQKLTDKLNN
tara:strand:- start:45 stop:296 length:252 start_codon:yes stop_codon:yes gene_type:complete